MNKDHSSTAILSSTITLYPYVLSMAFSALPNSDAGQPYAYNPRDYAPMAGPKLAEQKRKPSSFALQPANRVKPPDPTISTPLDTRSHYNNQTASPLPQLLPPNSQPMSPKPISPQSQLNQSPVYSSPMSPKEYLARSFPGITLREDWPSQAAVAPSHNHRHESPSHHQRPYLPHHQFTQPYIAPAHPPFYQTPLHLTPQFERSYQPAPTVLPQDPQPQPTLPPGLARPTSAPPAKYDLWQDTSFQKNMKSPTVNQNPPISSNDHADDPKSKMINRIVGNMLPVRVGRAGFQSMVSTAKLPYYHSPWGDNVPFVLPNIRKRDVAFSGLSHVTFGALSPGALSVVGKSVEHVVKMAAEHAVEEGVNHALSGRKGHRVKRRSGITSLQLRIRHKLLGELAEIAFVGERDAIDKRSCAKAWFCPYLYASGRTPQIARSKDFILAQFVGPGLAADASVAPTLLSTLPETGTSIISLCPWEASHPTFPRFRRMAVFLLGLSPFRKSWSQSRIPNEARFSCHLFNHVPAVVVPVQDCSPVIAWSPWTLELISLQGEVEIAQEGRKQSTKISRVDMDLAYGEMPHVQTLGQYVLYDGSSHLKELFDYLLSIVDPQLMEADCRSHWKSTLRQGLDSLLKEATRTHAVLGHDLGGVCKMERAGIVMFRY